MQGLGSGPRAGGLLAAAALGGCSAEPGAWGFATLALLLAAAGAGGVAWLLAMRRGRAELHAARQRARLLAELCEEPWQCAGQPPRLADGRPLEEVYAGGEALAAALAAPQAFGPLPARRCADGAEVELHGRPLHDADGAFSGHLGCARPLRAAPAAPEPDEQASLTYTVSHDLRAPIRVVEGFTRIVKEDYGARLDRVANDHLDRVLGATARMNQMIDAMLTLAQLSAQPLARQPVNLSQLAGFVVDDLRRGTPERDATVEIEPGMQAVGDPTLLRLVLENLLGNALKYSARRAQAHIVFGRQTVDGRSTFVVRDNGAGFDMRTAERLFGLFQRLHSSADFPGTGVGLASVRRIVQRHGGEIWADSEPGRGAAFYFTLRA